MRIINMVGILKTMIILNAVIIINAVGVMKDVINGMVENSDWGDS